MAVFYSEFLAPTAVGVLCSFYVYFLKEILKSQLCDIEGYSKWLSGFSQLVIHNTLQIAVHVFFYLIEHSRFLLRTLQLLFMCTLCDSTNTKTIVEFVPNCLYHVSGDGFNGGSDSYLQLRATCGKRNVTKTWSVVLLKKNIYCYLLKCIVYDKLLKPRQSFRITLYISDWGCHYWFFHFCKRCL